MEYLIISICSLGWVFAFHYKSKIMEMRKTIIKLSIIRDIDCSSQCSEEEYNKAKSELLDEISEKRKELMEKER